MNRYFCISATFLDPLFHGNGDDEPEWPPSPMRLFQALVAGARTGCRGREWSDSKAEAFRWLEGREPPLIVTPEARISSGCTIFVPNNDSDKTFDRQERLTSKVSRPHRLCDGDAVHYLWRIDSNDGAAQSHAEVLRREARHLLALGWGVDQAVGNGRILTDIEAAALPGRRWRAWTGHRPGSLRWRVPTDDSLVDLERVYQSFIERVDGRQYRPPLKLSRFGTVTYMSASALPARPYAVFEMPNGIGFRQEDAAKVAAMLRSLTSRYAKQDTHEFPGGSETYVAGHTGKHERTPLRFSYLPLPTIGHEHADGMIRRLFVAEPFGGDGTHARWAQNRLRNTTLQDQDGNQRGILLDPWRPSSNGMIRRYVDEARTWCTVTPAILPGFDDSNHAKAEKLFLRSVQQADLSVDSIAELTMRKAQFWPGSQHPRQYFVPSYLKHRSAWHVCLVFREPVPGPLAIGAGRHVGLGIFGSQDEPAALGHSAHFGLG